MTEWSDPALLRSWRHRAFELIIPSMEMRTETRMAKPKTTCGKIASLLSATRSLTVDANTIDQPRRSCSAKRNLHAPLYRAASSMVTS